MQAERTNDLQKEEVELVAAAEQGGTGLAAQEVDHCLSLALTVKSKEKKRQNSTE